MAVLAVLGGVLAFGGCASTPTAPASTASAADARIAAVKARAEARWKALIDGDVQAAYGYLSPASRELTSFEQYKAKTRTGAFRAAKVDKVECDADACTVKLMLTYDHPKMKGIVTPLEETWVVENGQFWYVYRG